MRVNSSLISNEVNAIAIDSNDRVWFGTNHGISVFDGENLITFTQENSGILFRTVNILFFDGKGYIWIGGFGTGNEVNRVPTDDRLFSNLWIYNVIHFTSEHYPGFLSLALLLPKLYSVPVPARHAYSHSASVGSLYPLAAKLHSHVSSS